MPIDRIEDRNGRIDYWKTSDQKQRWLARPLQTAMG